MNRIFYNIETVDDDGVYVEFQFNKKKYPAHIHVLSVTLRQQLSIVIVHRLSKDVIRLGHCPTYVPA
jgi:hypothetical protein